MRFSGVVRLCPAAEFPLRCPGGGILVRWWSVPTELVSRESVSRWGKAVGALHGVRSRGLVTEPVVGEAVRVPAAVNSSGLFTAGWGTAGARCSEKCCVVGSWCAGSAPYLEQTAVWVNMSVDWCLMLLPGRTSRVTRPRSTTTSAREFPYTFQWGDCRSLIRRILKAFYSSRYEDRRCRSLILIQRLCAIAISSVVHLYWKEQWWSDIG